jgi:transcriptional regulator with XRE-family HTH domain
MSNEQHPLITHLQKKHETLTAFAKRIGMSRMQLYRIMNGESTTTDRIRMISAATGGAVSVSDFFGKRPTTKAKVRQSA